MKKLISAILLVALLLSVAVPGLSASAAGTGSLALSSLEAAPGGTVNMELSLEENPGLNTLELKITYDTDVLELTGVSLTAELGMSVPNTNYSSPYRIAWVDASEGNNTTTGTIATLTFRVKATAPQGQTQVNATLISSYDNAYGKNEFAPATGTVTVTGPLVGDVNASGTVTSDDAIYLLYNTLLGDERYPLNQPCDFNRDGALSSDDAIYLLYNTLLGDERYPLDPLVS